MHFHNYADVGDNERGAMFLDWDEEPQYVNWSNVPKYVVMGLRQLLESTKSIWIVISCKNKIRCEY